MSQPRLKIHRPEFPIKWVAETGETHYLTLEGATRILKALYNEWPGGLDEVHAEIKAAAGRTQCRGVCVSWCDYLAPCDSICDKCGKVHVSSSRPIDKEPQ